MNKDIMSKAFPQRLAVGVGVGFVLVVVVLAVWSAVATNLRTQALLPTQQMPVMMPPSGPSLEREESVSDDAEGAELDRQLEGIEEELAEFWSDEELFQATGAMFSLEGGL